MAIGIVTNTEVEDATPAAMIAHTRRRGAYDQIVEQFFAAKPDVLMGGGSANFLPQAAPGSKAQGRRRLHRQIPRRGLSPRDHRGRTQRAGGQADRPSCSACSTPATWTARSTASFSRAAASRNFPSSPT